MSLPDREELGRGLSGALLLLRQDPGAMRYFNISRRGFWRSFYAAFFAGPAHLLLIALQPVVEDAVGVASSVDTTATEGGFSLGVLLGHLCVYAINWLAWPVVADVLCRNLKRDSEYPGYIIAYNWARVVQIYAVALVTLLSGMLFPGGGGFLVFIAMIGVLYFDWAIARVALKLPGMAAAGMVIADLMLGLFIFLLGEAVLS